MKQLRAFALFIAIFAAPACAEESPFYGGLMAGDSYLGILGGYQIDKMFSVEAHYAAVLHPTATIPGATVKTDTYMFGADLVALLPWKIKQVPKLTFFAKGGMDYVSNKVTTTGGTNSSLSTRETKLSLGGGVQYDVNRNFSARAGLGLMGYRNDLYVSAIYRF